MYRVGIAVALAVLLLLLPAASSTVYYGVVEEIDFGDVGVITAFSMGVYSVPFTLVLNDGELNVSVVGSAVVNATAVVLQQYDHVMLNVGGGSLAGSDFADPPFNATIVFIVPNTTMEFVVHVVYNPGNDIAFTIDNNGIVRGGESISYNFTDIWGVHAISFIVNESEPQYVYVYIDGEYVGGFDVSSVIQPPAVTDMIEVEVAAADDTAIIDKIVFTAPCFNGTNDFGNSIFTVTHYITYINGGEIAETTVKPQIEYANNTLTIGDTTINIANIHALHASQPIGIFYTLKDPAANITINENTTTVHEHSTLIATTQIPIPWWLVAGGLLFIIIIVIAIAAGGRGRR